jgi:cytochrome c-type biogenesis protein CcmH
MSRRVLPSVVLLALVLPAWLFAVPLAAPALSQVAYADGQPSVHSVASELMCQCGCSLTVSACQEAMECSVAEDMVQAIQRRLDGGESKQQILDYFASAYGEEVLASPRKSGFSLTAWVIPFLAVAAGGAVISAVTWAWVRRRSASLEAELSASGSEDHDLYQERVEEDLRLLEE